MQEWVSTRQVMRVLNIKSEETVRRWRRTGEVEWVRVGGVVRIRVGSDGSPVDPPAGYVPPPMQRQRRRS
jgi:hypothetical protein